MRFSLLGNLENPHSTEQHYLQALEDLGHEVIPLQEGKTTAAGLLKAARTSNILLWVHTHGWDTPGGIIPALRELKRASTMIVSYHLDLWTGLREDDLKTNPYFSGAINHFFSVDPALANWMCANTTTQGHYLPAAVAHRECYALPTSDEKQDIEVAFVGSHKYHSSWPYRGELIDQLRRRYGSRFTLVPGDGRAVRGADLNRLYSRIKVAVGDTLCPNFNYAGYWSDRVYETLGRGGFLVHPWIPGMEDQFRDHHHLAYYTYRDFDSLFDTIEFYLENPAKREEVRRNGHAEVHQAHTYIHRWNTILETITHDKTRTHRTSRPNRTRNTILAPAP